MFDKIFNWLKTVVQFLKSITQYRVMIPKEPEPPKLDYLNELLTNKKISDPEFRTLLLIHLLAARQPNYKLPPFKIETLAQLRRLSNRTLEFHLARLKRLGLIENTSLGDFERDIQIVGAKIFVLTGHEHVVVNKTMFKTLEESLITSTTNILEEQQHVQHVTRAEVIQLQSQMAEVFENNGESRPKAIRFAGKLIAMYGYDLCLRQLNCLDQRIENFTNGPGGLRSTPAGVLVASIKANWSLPSAPPKPDNGAWYTEEEFNQLIEH